MIGGTASCYLEHTQGSFCPRIRLNFIEYTPSWAYVEIYFSQAAKQHLYVCRECMYSMDHAHTYGSHMSQKHIATQYLAFL